MARFNGYEKDLKTLAQFMFIYETEIKIKSKDDEFRQISKNGFFFFKQTIQKKVKHATIIEIAVQEEFKKQTFRFTKDNKSQIYSFCRHIRNSFSHALLKKEGTKLYISDKKGNKETAKGFLEYSDVIEFMKIVITDYCEKFENNK